jgi:hypothetical protein
MNIINKVTGQLAHITTYDPDTGEITGFDPVGNINLGPISNVTITGGTAGQVLTTDGNGVLSFEDGGVYSNTAANTFLAGGQVGNIIPDGNAVNSLGNITNQWKDLWVSNATIYFNTVPLSAVDNTLTFAGEPLLVSGGNSNITTTGTIEVGGMVSDGNITVNTGYFFIGDGSQLTGLYSNADVSTYLSSATDTAGYVTLGDIEANNILAVNSLTTNVDLAVLGNAQVAGNLQAGFFDGDGSNVSNITGANVTGQVANSLVSATVYEAAQPNITSVGTLTSLNSSGNITAEVGAFFVGDGGFLSNIATGTVYSNANVANYLPTYTGNLGNVADITASGTITGNGIGLSNIAGANVSGQVANALVAGTVYEAAQPNITSVGTLTNLAVTGNVTAGFLYGDGSNITGLPAGYSNADVANYLPTYTGNLGNVDSISTSGNITVGTGAFFIGDGGLLSNVGGTGNAAGANTQIQFNDSNAFNGSANFTFTNTGSGIVTIGGELLLSGNGTIGTLGSNLLLQPAGNAIVEVAGRQWTYDLSGNLTVPGNIQSIATGGFTSNIIGIDTGQPTVLVILADLVFAGPETGQVTISGVVGTTEANGTWYFQATDTDRFELYTDNTFTTPVNGTTWTAYVSGGVAVSAGNYTNLTITGGNVIIGANTLLANGKITAVGNITSQAGSFFIGDGSLLTNLPVQPGTYSNSNVAAYIPTYTGNLGNVDSITTTGNITVGTGSFFIGDGTYLTNVPGAVAESSFSIETASFSAVAGSRYGVDTTGGAITATLPATPSTGQAIFFADAGGAYATNNLTVAPNGQTIMGTAGDLTVSTTNQNFGLFYNGTTWRTY